MGYWKKYVLTLIPFLFVACGGEDVFELTIVNTLQSTEVIRVDLGGELRSLEIGEVTIFRSVESGQRILSLDSTTCAGVIRDTITVGEDLTVRYQMSRNPADGECIIESSQSLTRNVIPISLISDDGSN